MRTQETCLTGSLARTLVRHATVVLILLTIVVAAVQTVTLRRRDQEASRCMFESFVRQGAGQLADLGRRNNTAGETSWSTITGPFVEQFRRWAWGVLQHEDVIAVALLDEQGRPLITIPQDAGVPRDALTCTQQDDISARRMAVRLNDRQEPVWRVTAVARRAGSTASQAGLVLLARRRAAFCDAWESVAVLSAAVLGTGSVLLLTCGLWFVRRLGRPLRALADAAERLDRGNLPRFPVERNDEIGAVARAMETLASMVSRSEERATHLERSMNSRVMDQTRQINAELRRAERNIWIDSLTKLGNRRLLNDRLEDIFQAQKRSGLDLCIVMLDLDNFKNLNDTRGHSAGDEMLRFVGELFQGALRPADIGVRYGGDEFAIVLVDTTPDEASSIAERFVRLFHQRAAVMDLDPPVSMSAGIASMLRDCPQSGKHLVDLADRALYKAKSRGKNCLCTSP